MENIKNNILLHTAHRPWALPDGKWTYYQEWNNALFLHWKVPVSNLLPLVPANLPIDTHNNEAWISLVAFTMEKTRPNGIPSLSAISDFHEINVRTYVTKDNKPGVYFFNIEAGKSLSAYIARQLSGLPYEKAKMKRAAGASGHSYQSQNIRKGFRLQASYTPANTIEKKNDLDLWLTERYCAYLDKRGQLCRYQIHHHPWPLQQVTIHTGETNYTIGNISLNKQPDLAHYSKGVQVITWKREEV